MFRSSSELGLGIYLYKLIMLRFDRTKLFVDLYNWLVYATPQYNE